jgi:hypothetical protein
MWVRYNSEIRQAHEDARGITAARAEFTKPL